MSATSPMFLPDPAANIHNMDCWRCHAPRHRESEMDDFDKVMTLLVLFGFGLAGFLAYGSHRLNQLEAELRTRANEEGRAEAVGASCN